MRYKLSLLIVCLFVQILSSAQSKNVVINPVDNSSSAVSKPPILFFRHQISIGAGNSSTDEQLNGKKEPWVQTDHYGSQISKKHYNIFALTYRCFLSPKFAIGLGAAFAAGQRYLGERHGTVRASAGLL